MNEFFDKTEQSIKHLQALHDFFNNPVNYVIPDEQADLEIYQSNLAELVKSFSEINAFKQLYNKDDRQLILADLFEYFLLGRAFYSMGNSRISFDKKSILLKEFYIL